MTIKEYLDEQAVARGCTLFSGKMKCFVSIKLNGKGCMSYSFNEEGINIWIRSGLCRGITTEFELKEHLFDARIRIGMNEDKKEMVSKLLDASIQYQQKMQDFKNSMSKLVKMEE